MLKKVGEGWRRLEKVGEGRRRLEKVGVDLFIAVVDIITVEASEWT